MAATTTHAELTTVSWSRRYWPFLALSCGSSLSAVAIVLGQYVNGRIVLIGPLDAAKIVALLGSAAVWCLAAAAIGGIAKVARGWVLEALAGLVAGAIVLGAFGLSVIIGIVTAIGLSVDPRYELDVPGSSSEYIVSTFTFGETRVSLYRGNGTVYKPIDVDMPTAADHISFQDAHRVETDARGNSFLVYPQETGGDARVLLP
ncbi:hypothetical protein [Aeromicrobium sp. P5_D10]